MIGFVATICAIFACGLAVSDRLWHRLGGDDDLFDAERLLSAAVIGSSIWLAASWVLAVTHLLTRPALMAVAAAMAAVALIASRAFRGTRSFPSLRLTWLLLPLAAWIVFALWKGVVLPPQSHDALAYHLPKAAMMAQAHGFEHFVAPDSRITNLPANYELTVADLFVMSGSDTLTEWIGTLAFLLFLCATAAMAERWWRDKAHRAMTVLAVAGAPVLLLHSTADKNDVMACMLAVAAVLWAARWSVHGGRMPMLLVILTLAIAGGTKPNAGAIFVAIAPFLLMRWRTIRVRDLALTAIVSIVAFLLLGGFAYIDIAHHSGGPMAVKVGQVTAGGGMVIPWGDFNNYWQVPYLMLTVPFITKPNAVWVPWRGEYWYWPHYEIFFSHWGALISILVFVALFYAWRVREPNRERRIATLATLFSAALILPVQLRPVGMFAAMPRYIAFALPVIACWSVPPAIEMLRSRSLLIARTFVAAIAVFFVVSAIDCAVNDRFAPLTFVIGAAHHPGTRAIWFTQDRAASVVDRIAGPNDTIAIDGMFDTWTYPAYGAHLSRHIVFVTTPEDVPPTAGWVIVDRAWSRLWEHPQLTDMGKMWTLGGHARPRPEDVALLFALRRDPHWALVYYDPRLIQAVFRRVEPGVIFVPSR